MNRFPVRARGVTKRGTMNLLERRYSDTLTYSKDVVWFKYEAVKLRLADGAYFTPDFIVMKADGELQFHEVKGFWREAAKVRIKVAAEIFPFKFIAVKGSRTGWQFEEF